MVNQLVLDPALRADLAERVLGALQSAVPGSTAGLRGSLAVGNADPYSDIDLLWELPDELFPAALVRLEDTLSSVQGLESLRFDPALQNSDQHRLVFAQFKGMPLFWRVDIEIFARSIHRDPCYDLHNEIARGADWSPTHSALMNAVAALKAVLRGQDEQARQLLVRGFERAGLPLPGGTAQEQVLALCQGVACIDTSQKDLCQRILELHAQAYGEAPQNAH